MGKRVQREVRSKHNDENKIKIHYIHIQNCQRINRTHLSVNTSKIHIHRTENALNHHSHTVSGVSICFLLKQLKFWLSLGGS